MSQKLYDKAYRRSHLEKCRASSRRWKRLHPKRHLVYNCKWNREHPEARATLERKRRARKCRVEEAFGIDEAQYVRDLWGNRCAICGKTEKDNGRALDIDHWNPLSKGYALTVGNAVPLCRSCNGRKIDKHPLETFGSAVVDRIEIRIEEQEERWNGLNLALVVA